MKAHTGSSDGAAAQLGGWRVRQIKGLSWAGGPQRDLPPFSYHSRVLSPFPSFPSRYPGCGQSVGQG